MRKSILAGSMAAAMTLGDMTAGAAAPDSTTATAPNAGIPAYLVHPGIPEPIRALEAEGRLADAEKMLEQAAMLDSGGGLAWGKPSDELTRLRWLRRDFPLDAPQLLEKLRKDIPDVTSADIDRWTRERTLQWITIDGATHYFRREPSNLFRFAKDARARRDAAKGDTTTTAAADPAAKSGAGFSLTTHIEKAVAAARDSVTSMVLPVRIHVRHSIAVKPGRVPAGKLVRCWMPWPKEYRHQGEPKLIAASPEKHSISPNDSLHRLVYMEQPAAADGSATFTLEYEYPTAAYVTSIDPDTVRPADPQGQVAREFTAGEAPHIVLTPEVHTLAAQLVGDEKNPYRKAERIFRWMQDNIRYCSEMEYAIMPAALDKIMAERRGDCGVQAIMFIGLCRASGVPARWQSGWVTRPGAWNMHDWAEFYVEPYGWIPADPSVGYRDSENPRVHDFFFGSLDAYRMIANLGVHAPFSPAKHHLRSDPVDSQRGEVDWEDGNLYYDDWDHEIQATEVK
jgi:hypothetical protein